MLDGADWHRLRLMAYEEVIDGAINEGQKKCLFSETF